MRLVRLLQQLFQHMFGNSVDFLAANSNSIHFFLQEVRAVLQLLLE
jgi:hypothetical protein